MCICCTQFIWYGCDCDRFNCTQAHTKTKALWPFYHKSLSEFARYAQRIGTNQHQSELVVKLLLQDSESLSRDKISAEDNLRITAELNQLQHAMDEGEPKETLTILSRSRERR
jgi:hypothetical protein